MSGVVRRRRCGRSRAAVPSLLPLLPSSSSPSSSAGQLLCSTVAECDRLHVHSCVNVFGHSCWLYHAFGTGCHGRWLPGHSFVVSSQPSNWGRGVLPGVGVNAWMQCCAVSLCAWCSTASVSLFCFRPCFFVFTSVGQDSRCCWAFHAAASRWFCV